MIQDQKTATLTTVLSEVLANLAFMFDDEEPTGPQPDQSWLEATISYNGPKSGTLTLNCPAEFSPFLASNLLGVSPEDEDAEQSAEDALRELMNVLCGQYVTARHGVDDVFDLTIPQVRQLSEPPLASLSDGEDSATTSIEGNRLQLRHSLST